MADNLKMKPKPDEPTRRVGIVATTANNTPAIKKLDGPTRKQSTAVLEDHDIVRHVPTRATSIDKILDYAEKKKITNELLIKVGLRMNHNLICGSNARCVAMLIAFKSIIHDLENDCLESQNFSEALLNSLKASIAFLEVCRPLSVSMTNTFKQLRDEIGKIQQQTATLALELNQIKAKQSHRQQLNEFIDRFIYEEVLSAQRGICENTTNKINRQNDVILVYGCSSIIQHVLLRAKKNDKQFKVIIVDSQPNFNGRRMLKFLNDHNISCSHTLINSLSYVMRQATKVLLGAHSILANGYVMAHIGTSQIALMAKACNVPVLVCCETYKFSERVYVDSFVCNEVDPPKSSSLSSPGSTELSPPITQTGIQQKIEKAETIKSKQLATDDINSEEDMTRVINLRYDVTPPEFVSMLITERSTIPAISVPAVLRFRFEQQIMRRF